MEPKKIILVGDSQRAFAKREIDAAPKMAVVTIRDATRTDEQSAKMWAMLGEISKAKPEGREHTPEVWKSIFMNALGHKIRFEAGLDGEVFPLGFRSSHLTIRQMSDLIEFILWYGASHGVHFREPERV